MLEHLIASFGFLAIVCWIITICHHISIYFTDLNHWRRMTDFNTENKFSRLEAGIKSLEHRHDQEEKKRYEAGIEFEYKIGKVKNK